MLPFLAIILCYIEHCILNRRMRTLSYWVGIGLFISKTIIVVIAIISVIIAIAIVTQKTKHLDGSGKLSIKYLNGIFNQSKNMLRTEIMDKKALKNGA